MAKKKKDEPTVNIDGQEYKVADLNQNQIMLVNHTADLDRKLSQAEFNVAQLRGGRTYFMGLLTESLNAE